MVAMATTTQLKISMISSHSKLSPIHLIVFLKENALNYILVVGNKIMINFCIEYTVCLHPYDRHVGCGVQGQGVHFLSTKLCCFHVWRQIMANHNTEVIFYHQVTFWGRRSTILEIGTPSLSEIMLFPWTLAYIVCMYCNVLARAFCNSVIQSVVWCFFPVSNCHFYLKFLIEYSFEKLHVYDHILLLSKKFSY
jgi:hypothetical protein